MDVNTLGIVDENTIVRVRHVMVKKVSVMILTHREQCLEWCDR